MKILKEFINLLEQEVAALENGAEAMSFNEMMTNDAVARKLKQVLAQTQQILLNHTDDATGVVPKVNIRCETTDGNISGSTYLEVVRVEAEDDGSFTAVTNHWPS